MVGNCCSIMKRTVASTLWCVSGWCVSAFCGAVAAAAAGMRRNTAGRAAARRRHPCAGDGAQMLQVVCRHTRCSRSSSPPASVLTTYLQWLVK